LAHALFVWAPEAVRDGVEHHLHSLEDDPFGLPFDLKNTFAPVHIGSRRLDHLGQPRLNPLELKRTLLNQIKRPDGFIVMMLVWWERFIGQSGFVTMSVLMVRIVLMSMLVFVFVLFMRRLGRQGQRRQQIARFDVQNVTDLDLSVAGAMDAGERIDFTKALGGVFQFRWRNEIDFVQQDDIGESDLSGGFSAVSQLLVQMFRIYDRHNRVEPQPLGQFGGTKGVGDRARVGQAGCFDQDIIEAFLFPQQRAETFDQVAADPATKTAIIQFEDFFIDTNDQLVVDANRAELVDDDRALVTVLLRDQVVEERGLARAQKPCQDRHWNRIFHLHGHILPQTRRHCNE